MFGFGAAVYEQCGVPRRRDMRGAVRASARVRGRWRRFSRYQRRSARRRGLRSGGSKLFPRSDCGSRRRRPDPRALGGCFLLRQSRQQSGVQLLGWPGRTGTGASERNQRSKLYFHSVTAESLENCPRRQQLRFRAAGTQLGEHDAARRAFSMAPPLSTIDNGRSGRLR